MKANTSALFLIFLFTASVFASQENLLELMDQSKEGRDILNAIFLQLHTTGAHLQRGKIIELLTTAKQNANKSENRQKQRLARARAQCTSDLKVLNAHLSQNEKHEFTINRHLNANQHAINKNQQFITRSTNEKNNYVALKNLVKANRAAWRSFVNGRMARQTAIIRLLKNARKQLINAHKAALGTEFVEVKPEVISALSELRVEFTNTEDHFDGLRPIIANLLQNMSNAVVGKNVLRSRLINLLKLIVRAVGQRRDLLEQQNEAANAIFEALLKTFNENITRVDKLLERLSHEKNLLSKRGLALTDSLARAQRITKLSVRAASTKNRQCHQIKVRNARLHVATQKIRNVVAQIEEMLQERFGALKTFFLERKMKFEDKQ
jgi:hypothetical protein